MIMLGCVLELNSYCQWKAYEIPQTKKFFVMKYKAKSWNVHLLICKQCFGNGKYYCGNL